MPEELRKMIKFLIRSVAANAKPPWAISAYWNDKVLGETCVNLYKNVNLRYPFDHWHLIDKRLLMVPMNYFVNGAVAVKSKRLDVPRQKRFVLDHKGNILDFERMSSEEIEAFYSDEIEQERQNAPGLRHRNGPDAVQCRLFSFGSKSKALESLQRIKEATVSDCKVGCQTVRINNNNSKSKNGTENSEINPENTLLVN